MSKIRNERAGRIKLCHALVDIEKKREELRRLEQKARGLCAHLGINTHAYTIEDAIADRNQVWAAVAGALTSSVTVDVFLGPDLSSLK